MEDGEPTRRPAARRPWAAAGAILSLAGCAARENIPVYPKMTDEGAMRQLAERARAIRSVTAAGDVTLTRPGGDSVRMDAAFVTERTAAGQNVRLRAWKFGQAVFDLTVNEDGVFLVAPRDAGDTVRSAGTGARRFVKAWSEFSGAFFDRPAGLRVVRESPMTVRGDVGSLRVTCEVDRRTLTPRVYRVADDGGAERFRLELSKYARHGDVVYPHRLLAVSGEGTVEVELRDVEVNGEVAAGAFVPPARAERLP